MNRNYLFIIILSLFICIGGADAFGAVSNTSVDDDPWTSLSFTNKYVRRFEILNDGFAYAIAGDLYKSYDEGKTWEAVALPIQGTSPFYLEDAFFCNKDTFLLRLSKENVLWKSLYRTFDGGVTWKEIDLPGANGPIVNFDSFSFYKKQMSCYIETSRSRRSLYKSNDFGDTWELYSDFSGNGFVFLNELDGFTVCFDGLYRTSDGGRNWTRIIETRLGYRLKQIHFVNDQVGYVRTNECYILKTTDGGETWKEIATPDGYWDNMAFQNENIGYLLTYGGLYVTYNGGGTLERLKLKGLTKENMYVHDYKLYCYGSNGVLQMMPIVYPDANLGVLLTSNVGAMEAVFDCYVASNCDQAIEQISVIYRTLEGKEKSFSLPVDVQPGKSKCVTVNLENLIPYTFYYYKISCVAGGETYYSNELYFRTSSELSASFYQKEISDVDALFNIYISGIYDLTDLRVEYDTDPLFQNAGVVVPEPNQVPASVSVECVTVRLKDLQPSTTYNVRLRAKHNSQEIEKRLTDSFQTRPAYTLDFSCISNQSDSFSGDGRIICRSKPLTDLHVAYGTHQKYDRRVDCEPSEIKANTFLKSYIFEVNGMAQDSIYYFRLEATHADTTIYSKEVMGIILERERPAMEIGRAEALSPAIMKLYANFFSHDYYTLWFEYGEDKDNLDNRINYPYYSSTHSFERYVYALDLKPDTKYYYRMAAQGYEMEEMFYTETGRFTTWATGNPEVRKTPYVAHPNPVSDLLYIQGISTSAKVEVLDSRGVSVLSAIADSLTPLSVSSLAPGMYFVRITENNAAHLIKIIKK